MTTRMRARDRQLHMLLAAVLVLFATIGCGLAGPTARVGELRTKSESVELGGAETVQVEIAMAAGQLAIRGGASELLEADFTYNVDKLEPEVVYSGGTLGVRTPEVSVGATSWQDLEDYRYEWDLRLNDDVAMEMKIDLAAGTGDLDLGSLSLTALDIQTGASEVRVDLSDSQSLGRLDLESGIGQTTVDLSGDWQNDLEANMTSGVGELNLRLPRNVCVRVDVESGLGNVETTGLTSDGGVYVNDACGASAVTLRIEVEAGVGSVKLVVEE
ncbi:MAG TPA: toast rack family protein [Anaerolineales bacterium]|nr:toast rack family protein [Anaerolineales bacterium]